MILSLVEINLFHVLDMDLDLGLKMLNGKSLFLNGIRFCIVLIREKRIAI